MFPSPHVQLDPASGLFFLSGHIFPSWGQMVQFFPSYISSSVLKKRSPKQCSTILVWELSLVARMLFAFMFVWVIKLSKRLPEFVHAGSILVALTLTNIFEYSLNFYSRFFFFFYSSMSTNCSQLKPTGLMSVFISATRAFSCFQFII